MLRASCHEIKKEEKRFENFKNAFETSEIAGLRFLSVSRKSLKFQKRFRLITNLGFHISPRMVLSTSKGRERDEIDGAGDRIENYIFGEHPFLMGFVCALLLFLYISEIDKFEQIKAHLSFCGMEFLRTFISSQNSSRCVLEKH